MLGKKQRRKIDTTNKKKQGYKFIALNQENNLSSTYKRIPNKIFKLRKHLHLRYRLVSSTNPTKMDNKHLWIFRDISFPVYRSSDLSFLSWKCLPKFDYIFQLKKQAYNF